MKLQDVHASIIAQLAAAPALAPYLPAIIEDGNDREADILAALATKGVCFALTDIESAIVDNSTPGLGCAAAKASAQLLIFEDPATTHSPAGLVLLDSVVRAIISSRELQVENLSRFSNEKGGVLCVADISATILFET